MEPPAEWPPQVRESYEPLRVLGVGGFGSVVLARETKPPPEAPADGRTRPKKVAVKMVGAVGNNKDDYDDEEQQDMAVLYARREIEILQHVSHPGIVRLFHHWIVEKETASDQAAAAVLVLEYAKGPTVESLLKHGGALSTTFGQVVIAQVVDALAYLHYRAVLHRDIKPDNILVTGALSSDASIWDNDDEHDPSEKPDWAALRKKYKVTLIDFGFARALTPGDVAKPNQETMKKDARRASYHELLLNENAKAGASGEEKDLSESKRKSLLGSSMGRSIRKRLSGLAGGDSIDKSNRSTMSNDSLGWSRRSVSHGLTRTMSTLGNRNFAAPEIINNVRKSPKDKASTGGSKPTPGSSETDGKAEASEAPITETILEFVADYGLLVDSYSLGQAIKYMMTGVHPGRDLEEAIRSQERRGLLGSLCPCLSSREASSPKKRSVRYRGLDDLPGKIFVLIGLLLEVSTQKRVSVRKARQIEWIDEILAAGEPKPPEDGTRLYALDKLSYLPFAEGSANATPGVQAGH